MDDLLKTLASGAAIVLALYFVVRRSDLDREVKGNEHREPLSDHQVRWTIRAMREDIHMLMKINMILLAIIAFAVVGD